MRTTLHAAVMSHHQASLIVTIKMAGAEKFRFRRRTSICSTNNLLENKSWSNLRPNPLNYTDREVYLCKLC
jgi:hypothetical protein